MPLLDNTTLIVLAVTAALTLWIGWRRPFVMLGVLVLGVPFRDVLTRWLNVNTDLSIQTVTALGRWWFAVVLALGLLLAVRLVLEGRGLWERLDLGWPDWLFLTAGAIAVIATVLSSNRSAAFLSLRGYLQPMAIYALARVFLPSRAEVKWLLVGLVVVGVVMAGFGLWQGLLWEEADFRAQGYVRQNGDLVTPPTRIGGRIYIRPASTVSGPNEFGLDMVVLFAAALLMTLHLEGGYRWLGFGLTALFTAALVATFSRSGFVGYVVGWLGLAWLERDWIVRRLRSATGRRRLAVGLGGLAIVIVLAAGLIAAGFYEYLARTARGISQTYHIVDTVDAIQYLAAHPLGVGMGLVEPKGALALIQAGGTYHVEGSLLQIAMEMSVVGLLVWLTYWAVSLIAIARNVNRLEEPMLRVLSGAAFAGWLGSLVAFVFLPLMQSISLMVWLWFLLGLGVAADRIEGAWRDG